MSGPTVITTVTTAATGLFPGGQPYDLIDLATVKDELAISGSGSDAFLARKITQVSDEVHHFCNRVFQVEALSEKIYPWRDEVHFTVLSAERMQPLQVSRWPISAAPTVVETAIDGTAVPLVENTDYLVKYNVGQLVRLDANGLPKAWHARLVTVQYSAGFTTIPSDIQDAVTRLIKILWFARNRDPMLRQENVTGVWEGSYWFAAGPGSSTGNMPPDVEAILEKYRVPVVG